MFVLIALLARQNLRPMRGEAAADLGNRPLSVGQTYDGCNTIPPTPGPHCETKAPDGTHTEPGPNELQVHNLEVAG